MAVPQVGIPGATFKQKAKGSQTRRGNTVQAATHTGASEHLGSLPGFSLAFRETYLSFLCLSSQELLAAIFIKYLKALWMGNIQDQWLSNIRV